MANALIFPHFILTVIAAQIPTFAASIIIGISEKEDALMTQSSQQILIGVLLLHNLLLFSANLGKTS